MRALAVSLFLVLAAPDARAAFDLNTVTEKARKLAEEPYKDPAGKVPDWLLKVSYDQWRDIRFRADHALWRDAKLPFQVQFFHPGLYYDRVVAVNVVKNDKPHPVEFSPSQFDYGKNDFASKVPQDLGYAGFRRSRGARSSRGSASSGSSRRRRRRRSSSSTRSSTARASRGRTASPSRPATRRPCRPNATSSSGRRCTRSASRR